ncbi:hypothetical protein ACFQS1_01270 [Paractinoplanes rhizophilus]|jgi:hypothetical protein|uniref:Uncharacterized protein n=1 Tax=Paractinoplanes rhizophilus TaxID=1416877 RepID=A0ABW2HJM1_9ACTN
MRTVTVTAPSGTAWRVRVVWAPRWRALARRFGGWRSKRTGTSGDVVDGALEVGGNMPSSGGGGGGSGLGDEIAAIVFVLIAFVLAAALFWWVLLPLLLLVLDLVIVLLLLAVSVVARVLFRRPWTVEATATGQPGVAQQVVGWRAALRRRDEIADALGRGLRPEPMPSPLQR